MSLSNKRPPALAICVNHLTRGFVQRIGGSTIAERPDGYIDWDALLPSRTFAIHSCAVTKVYPLRRSLNQAL
jgi:hypothetical protein